jgi:hypothetical protein
MNGTIAAEEAGSNQPTGSKAASALRLPDEFV